MHIYIYAYIFELADIDVYRHLAHWMRSICNDLQRNCHITVGSRGQKLVSPAMQFDAGLRYNVVEALLNIPSISQAPAQHNLDYAYVCRVSLQIMSNQYTL